MCNIIVALTQMKTTSKKQIPQSYPRTTLKTNKRFGFTKGELIKVKFYFTQKNSDMLMIGAPGFYQE